MLSSNSRASWVRQAMRGGELRRAQRCDVHAAELMRPACGAASFSSSAARLDCRPRGPRGRAAALPAVEVQAVEDRGAVRRPGECDPPAG